jgi:putative endonuclease
VVTEVWFVYVLYSIKTAKLYTGISKNPQQRLERHNAGKGAKYTRQGRPWRIVYLEPKESRGDALRREYEIKGLTRAEKLLLVGLAA